jgi:hypothetical protein
MTDKQHVDIPIQVASDDSVKAILKGTVYVTAGHTNKTLKLNDVLYVPKLMTNLLSLSRIDQQGYQISCRKGKLDIHDEKGGPVLQASLRGDNLYQVDVKLITEHALNTEVRPSAQLWHRRLGHTGCSTIKQLCKPDSVQGLPEAQVFKNPETCWDCATAKHALKPFPTSEHSTSRNMELVHSDVVGPMDVPSVGGGRYAITLLDDFSRYKAVGILATILNY